MRLRTSIVAPERFGDEDYSKVAATKTTTPAFPNLLAGATAAFDPHLPPAAFPSSTHLHPIVQPTNIDPESMIIDRPSYDIFIPVVHHDSTQTDALVTMPDGANEMPEFGRDFVDEVATSDEELQVNTQTFAIQVYSNLYDLSRIRPNLSIVQLLALFAIPHGTSLRHLYRSRSLRTLLTANSAQEPTTSLA